MPVSVFMCGERIKIVIGRGSSRSLHVRDMYDLPLGDECPVGGIITPDSDISSALASIWKEHRLPKSGVRLTIDSTQFYLKPLTLPNLGVKKLLQVIRNEISENNVFQQPVVDYKIMRKNGKEIDLIAVAAEQTFVESYIKAFSDAGIGLASIDCAVCSAIDFITGMKQFEKNTYIAEMLEGDTLQSVLVCDGVYRYSHRTRLFGDPGTPEFSGEIGRTVSSILQFHASEKIESRVSNIYFFGLPEECAGSVVSSVKNAYGISASIPTLTDNTKKAVIPKTVLTENGDVSADPGGFIAVCGNLMTGRMVK